MDKGFQHRVVKRKQDEPDNVIVPPTENVEYVGRSYREGRKQLNPGESISIEKRAVSPWETVESETK